MREETWLNDYVFTVENFVSKEECEKYIQISEESGFEDALVTSPTGSVSVKDLRNNERVMFASEEIAAWLWERAENFVPQEFEGRSVVGVNELIRFYRYDPGQQFDWHQDFSFERDNGEKSYLTLLVYLNDDYEGGETMFEDSYSDESFDELTVVPEQGLALFFEHPVHHKGNKVHSGRKYVLRTDIMYGHSPDDDAIDDFGETYEDEWN